MRARAWARFAEPELTVESRFCGDKGGTSNYESSKMKAYELKGPEGAEGMALVEKPLPIPGPGQVLVHLKAATLNYRDLLTVKGGYGSRQKFPLVPFSVGAGVVHSFVLAVTRLRAGDRVIGSF